MQSDMSSLLIDQNRQSLAKPNESDVTVSEMTASTMLHLLCRITLTPITNSTSESLFNYSSRLFCYSCSISFPELIPR